MCYRQSGAISWGIFTIAADKVIVCTIQTPGPVVLRKHCVEIASAAFLFDAETDGVWMPERMKTTAIETPRSL
jgi:hypothetical protein